MKREVKFRFVDKDGIIYGPMRLIDLVEQAKSCAKDPLASFISSKNSGGLTLNEFSRGMNKGEIEAEQYTGVLDECSDEICEGDILQDFNNDCLFQVAWENGSFIINSIDPVPTVEMLGDISTDGLEVIGNIHENPELLEGLNDDPLSGDNIEKETA